MEGEVEMIQFSGRLGRVWVMKEMISVSEVRMNW